MCGIYGSFHDQALPPGEEARAHTMADLLAHRGPDHDGLFVTNNAILGSQRLAIVDPSPNAAQPFTSPDGKVALVCNGEIYNAAELRRRYAGRYPFRSDHNDVEPVLALYLDRGETAIAELDGGARTGRLAFALGAKLASPDVAVQVVTDPAEILAQLDVLVLARQQGVDLGLRAAAMPSADPRALAAVARARNG